MINLLPQAYRDEIKKEYYYRLGITMLAFIAAALTLGAFLVIPSLYYLIQEERVLQSQVPDAGNSIAASETGAFENTVERLQWHLAILKVELSETRVSDLIRTLLEKRPDGITIVSVYYERKQDGKDTVILKGMARAREQLINLVHVLESEPSVDDVELPISDLAGNENITFTMTLAFKEGNVVRQQTP